MEVLLAFGAIIVGIVAGYSIREYEVRALRNTIADLHVKMYEMKK